VRLYPFVVVLLAVPVSAGDVPVLNIGPSCLICCEGAPQLDACLPTVLPGSPHMNLCTMEAGKAKAYERQPAQSGATHVRVAVRDEGGHRRGVGIPLAGKGDVYLEWSFDGGHTWAQTQKEFLDRRRK